MKKNKLFVLGLVAVFVAILSLTLVSGTWAKYTSTVTGSDTARVAKWSFDGVDLADANKKVTVNLFNTIKDSDGNTEEDVKTAGKNENTIIAPGTKGTGTFTLKNTGEVNAKATVTFTVTNANNIPVQFTDKDGEKLTATDGTYTLGEVTLSMNDETGQTLTLNWEWPFNGNDTTDTTLGVAGTAEITVEVTVVFTQVD